MPRFLWFLVALVASIPVSTQVTDAAERSVDSPAKKFRVLVVAGGHGYPVKPFREVFAGYADMECTFVDIKDEVYQGHSLDPQVQVLLTTDEPSNAKAVAWVHTYRKSPVCYFQLGHDAKAYSQPEFREFLGRAIRWTAGKLPAASEPVRSATGE